MIKFFDEQLLKAFEDKNFEQNTPNTAGTKIVLTFHEPLLSEDQILLESE